MSNRSAVLAIGAYSLEQIRCCCNLSLQSRTDPLLLQSERTVSNRSVVVAIWAYSLEQIRYSCNLSVQSRTDPPRDAHRSPGKPSLENHLPEGCSRNCNSNIKNNQKKSIFGPRQPRSTFEGVRRRWFRGSSGEFRGSSGEFRARKVL